MCTDDVGAIDTISGRLDGRLPWRQLFVLLIAFWLWGGGWTTTDRPTSPRVFAGAGEENDSTS